MKRGLPKSSSFGTQSSGSQAGESDTESKNSSQGIAPWVMSGLMQGSTSVSWSSAEFCVSCATLTYSKTECRVSYLIEAKIGQETFKCEKRFSELATVHDSLKSIFKEASKAQGAGSWVSSFVSNHRPRGKSTISDSGSPVPSTHGGPLPGGRLSASVSPSKRVGSPVPVQSTPPTKYPSHSVTVGGGPSPHESPSPTFVDPMSQQGPTTPLTRPTPKHVRTTSSSSTATATSTTTGSGVYGPATTGVGTMPSFPKKRLIGNTNTSVQYIIERRHALDQYFRCLPPALLREVATGRVMEMLFFVSGEADAGFLSNSNSYAGGGRNNALDPNGKKQILSYFSLSSQFLQCRNQAWYDASHLGDWSAVPIHDAPPLQTVPKSAAGLLPSISVRLPHTWLEVNSIHRLDHHHTSLPTSAMTPQRSSPTSVHPNAAAPSALGGALTAVVESNRDEGRAYRKYRLIEFLCFYEFLATREGGLLPDVAQVKDFFQGYRAKNPVTSIDLVSSLRSMGDVNSGSKLVSSLKGRESLPNFGPSNSSKRRSRDPPTPRPPSQLRNLRNSSELLALLAESLATSQTSQGPPSPSSRSLRPSEGQLSSVECSNSQHLEWLDEGPISNDTEELSVSQPKVVPEDGVPGWSTPSLCLCTNRRYCVSTGIGQQNAVTTQLRAAFGEAQLTIHPPTQPREKEDLQDGPARNNASPGAVLLGDGRKRRSCSPTNTPSSSPRLDVRSRTDIPTLVTKDMLLVSPDVDEEENRMADDTESEPDADEVET